MKYLMWIPILGFFIFVAYYFMTWDEELTPLPKLENGIFYWGMIHLMSIVTSFIIYLILFGS